jgi:DNA polymerase V
MTVYATPSGVAVHAGFPNPATDTTLQGIDLNKYLVQHSIATYFMRIEGSAWQDFGIFSNDVLIIDRVLTPRKNDLIIWWEGDSFVLGHRASLPMDAQTWGVVTTAIHQFVKPELADD